MLSTGVERGGMSKDGREAGETREDGQVRVDEEEGVGVGLAQRVGAELAQLLEHGARERLEVEVALVVAERVLDLVA